MLEILATINSKRNCTNQVAKTKALISCAVNAQLICAFVFAYAKIRGFHYAAHIIKVRIAYCRSGNIRENLIFANIRELVASRIQSSR